MLSCSRSRGVSQVVALLTHAGLLAVHGDDKSGSPVKRGLMVRSTLLCHDIPPPPQDVVDTIEPPGEVKTTRQRYEAHLTNVSCSGCHQNIDPIGFAFENYDAIGRYRTEENGVPVDASGEIVNTVDINGKLVGAVELTHRLVRSSELSACVSKNFYRFALGLLETAEDACTLETLNAEFLRSGTSLNQLARTLAETDSFSRRIQR